ncbi:hypothetical protein V8G54_030963 [Vigna mungo]|uniref:Uncharacterized protein n=1 Tax=Vigna mungo TaxID=3915 RepID=A0AAQ3MXF9_VIGMU
MPPATIAQQALNLATPPWSEVERLSESRRTSRDFETCTQKPRNKTQGRLICSSSSFEPPFTFILLTHNAHHHPRATFSWLPTRERIHNLQMRKHRIQKITMCNAIEESNQIRLPPPHRSGVAARVWWELGFLLEKMVMTWQRGLRWQHRIGRGD